MIYCGELSVPFWRWVGACSGLHNQPAAQEEKTLMAKLNLCASRWLMMSIGLFCLHLLKKNFELARFIVCFTYCIPSDF
jgi:hypothetical protein